MSETRPAEGRRPRSEARRALAAATSEQPAGVPRPKVEPMAELVLFPRSGQGAGRDTAAHGAEAWEDTSIVLEIPEQRAFLKRQPPVFWIAAAMLMVAMLAALISVGVDMWREAEASRAEARRQRQIAEEKAKYKLLHRDLIDTYAAGRGLDPALVAAVIYNESRFDPSAVSRVGARGLMQIMDATGGWIAESLGEKSTYTQESLFDPETNIRYGTWYLGFLARMFDGDMVKMAAGYHAGQNKVIEWLADPACSPDGKTLSKIPFPDTEQYVSRVVNAYEIYTRHYYAPQETPPDTAGS